jgi:hypothetical protein
MVRETRVDTIMSIALHAESGGAIPGREQMKISRSLIAAAALVAAGAAQAGLSFQTSDNALRTEAFNGVAGVSGFGLGTDVDLGSLVTDELGTITFTYLGQESGYVNSFHFGLGGLHLFESNPVGTSVSAFVGAPGAIDFRFEGAPGKFAQNGGSWASGTSIGLIDASSVNWGPAMGAYQFILGYNDSAGASRLGDWDDLVIGVNFTPAVPEPQTYALMLAGLGAVAFLARRRRNDQ